MFKNTKNCKKRIIRVFFLGDSIVKHLIKHVRGYKISSHIENFKVYVKRFPVAKTRCMKDYTQPTIRGNPDQIIIHVATNDLPTTVELALKLKTNSCDISVSNIVPRDDQYREKASAVNHQLKDLCKEKKPMLY